MSFTNSNKTNFHNLKLWKFGVTELYYIGLTSLRVLLHVYDYMLQNIISPSQSAFIPNRLITDNVVVGYECLHKIRLTKGGK